MFAHDSAPSRLRFRRFDAHSERPDRFCSRSDL